MIITSLDAIAEYNAGKYGLEESLKLLEFAHRMMHKLKEERRIQRETTK